MLWASTEYSVPSTRTSLTPPHLLPPLLGDFPPFRLSISILLFLILLSTANSHFLAPSATSNLHFFRTFCEFQRLSVKKAPTNCIVSDFSLRFAAFHCVSLRLPAFREHLVFRNLEFVVVFETWNFSNFLGRLRPSRTTIPLGRL